MLVDVVPTPPFRLDFTVWALRRLPVNDIDRWDGVAFRRVLAVGSSIVEIEVTQPTAVSVTGAHPAATSRDADSTGLSGGTLSAGGESLRIAIRGDGNGLPPSVERQVVEALSHALGLQVDLAPFYRLAAGDERLNGLVSRFRGLKPPCLLSPFETVVNGIACQQLSLNVGIILLNRLCNTFGPHLDEAIGFPDPEDLAGADPDALRALGFSRRKAETIVAIAQSVVSGELDLEGLSRLDDQEVAERLMAVKGIGRWTAQYVALRGLGRWDVFPVDDVGGQNKVQDWLHLAARPQPPEMQRLLAPYAPYRGLVYFHLLLSQLQADGMW